MARESRDRLARTGRRLNRQPRLLAMARAARQLLPGDPRFGDPLSTAGSEPQQLVGRRMSTLVSEQPGVLGEVGLGALQVWQALSEAQGRGRGEQEIAILFTDLADWSSWAVEAGDTLALELLRDVGEALEPPIAAQGGQVVKRLGDGLMAVFPDARSALDAVLEGRRRLAEVEVGGHSPRLRAGLHVGRPRRLGGDYLGVDVNVAARLIEEAGADELLVSDRALEGLDGVEARRRRRFRAKGAPSELTAHAIQAW